ncbi:MAG: AAC(3) family N-acetyltransferase [Bacteroidales bacterium]
MVFNLIKKIIGNHLYIRLRSLGYKLAHTIYPPFSYDAFRDFLTEELGIKKGDTLFIHSSIDKLNVDCSPDQIINLLLELVGSEGTLAFPCWHFQQRAEEYLTDPDNLYHVKKSPSVMGLLPELARRNKEALRSLHPTSAVTAIGKHARELIYEHHLSEYPCGKLSPFYKIINYNGKILGLGEKPESSLSFVHCVEDELAGTFPIKTRTDEVYNGNVIDYQGNKLQVKTRAAHKNIQNRNIGRFFKKYISPNECKLIRKKASWFFVADSVRLHNKLKMLALQGKTIYSTPQKNK